MVEAYLEVLSRHYQGEYEENHEKRRVNAVGTFLV